MQNDLVCTPCLKNKTVDIFVNFGKCRQIKKKLRTDSKEAVRVSLSVMDFLNIILNALQHYLAKFENSC